MLGNELTLIILILVPVILLTSLRVNAAFIFLCLCLGDVLSQFIAPDSSQFFALFSAHLPKSLSSGNDLTKIIILILPAVLSIFFMLKSVHGLSKIIINLLPAIGCGLLLALLITPLLPKNLLGSSLNSSLWVSLHNYKDIIISLSSLISLILLWLQRPKSVSKKMKHSKS